MRLYKADILYPLTHYPEWDEPIKRIAKAFGGQCVASGAGLGLRDMEFDFLFAVQRKRFAIAVTRAYRLSVRPRT